MNAFPKNWRKFVILCAGLFCLATLGGCGDDKATIKGQVYVVTKGREVIKMPLVGVVLYEQQAVYLSMRESTAQLKSEYPNYLQRYRQASPTAQGQVVDAWVEHQGKVVRGALQRNRAQADYVQTDSEGMYKITLRIKEAGDYALVAFGTRSVGGQTEQYYWNEQLFSVSPGRVYTRDLDNSDDMNVPDLETFGEDLQLVLLMQKLYGLKVTQLP